MPLDSTTLKDLMKSNIEALTDFPTQGQNPVVVDDRVLNALASAIVSHIQSHATIELQAGDIKVDPGSFTNPAGNITGVGTSEAESLTGRIQ